MGAKSYKNKNNSVSHLCHLDSKVFWNRGGGGHWERERR